MRKTVTLDDDLYERLRRRKEERGTTMKAVVNEVLAAGLTKCERMLEEKNKKK